MNIKTTLCFSFGMTLSLFAAACSSPAPSSPSTQTAPTPVAARTLKNSGTFTISLKTDPAVVKPGEKVKLAFAISDATGKPVRDLDIVHEMPLHLIIVSEDLGYFDHIHPMPQSDGSLVVETSFPAAGKYRMFSDYTPKGGGNQVGQIEVSVAGTPSPAKPLSPDQKMTADFDGLRITVSSDKPIRTNETLMLTFELADAATGKPVTDLQPYLGALAHFVVISQDANEYLHVHPMDPSEMKKGGHDHHGDKAHDHGPAPVKGGPAVSAHTSFTKAGMYKIWGQFKRNDKIVTSSFVLNVAEGAVKPGQAANVANGKQEVVVTVSGDGYEPSTVSLKAGVPARIIFKRKDADNCGGEVVFKELDIRKKLPVGQEVTVEFTPEKAKTYSFACGMNMYKGKINVQ
jgi:plastocyanin